MNAIDKPSIIFCIKTFPYEQFLNKLAVIIYELPIEVARIRFSADNNEESE